MSSLSSSIKRAVGKAHWRNRHSPVTISKLGKKTRVSKRPSYREYMKSAAWRIRRAKFIDAHKSKVCELCGSNYKLHVHHIHYATVAREKDKDLALLCSSCHRNVHFIGDERLPLTRSVMVTRFKELKQWSK